MGDVTIGELQISRSEYPTIHTGLIHFQPAAIGRYQRHADGSIVKCTLDACFKPSRGGGLCAPLDRLRLSVRARPSVLLTVVVTVSSPPHL